MVKSSSVRQSWEAALRLSEARQVIQPKRPEPDRTARRLAACVNVDDVRQLAKRRLPRAVFDFVDGGADDEVTERENTAAFQSWRFSPRVLQDVGGADITTELFGRRYGAPLGLCPTGCPSMIHPLGEVAVARAQRSPGAPVLRLNGRQHVHRSPRRNTARRFVVPALRSSRPWSHSFVGRAGRSFGVPPARGHG